MIKKWYLLIFVALCGACTTTSKQQNMALEWLDKPAHVQAAAIQSGELSSYDLVSGYLARIERLDTDANSILAINSQALEQAKRIDAKIETGENVGALAGIPVLLKDNIETSEMVTTAGSMALLNNMTERDAPIVAKLKASDAIILG